MARKLILEKIFGETPRQDKWAEKVAKADLKADELRRSYERLNEADQRNKALATRRGRGSSTDAKAKGWPLVIFLEGGDVYSRKPPISVYIDPNQQRPVAYVHSSF